MKLSQNPISIGQGIPSLYKRTVLLFAIEGMLFSLITNLINNNNLLFATRLGANNFQLGLAVALPQLIGMLVLIPGGILADGMDRKKKVVILAILCQAGLYGAIGFTPFLGKYSLWTFLILLAVSVGPLTLYNASWQAFFSDVVPEESRNGTLATRTRGTFFISILIPVATGVILASQPHNSQKVIIHQSFFWISAALLIFQYWALRGIRDDKVVAPIKTTLPEIKETLRALCKQKAFLGFVGTAIFFYLTWHSDWTLYYIGQARYLSMNETWLGYANVGAALMQFVTIGFWSRINEKIGIAFPIVLGTLGLACCPLSMIIATGLPPANGKVVFLILNTLSNFAFATIMLNIIQCLLKVVPEKNKALGISVYLTLVALSNAVMPMVGVQIYSALGASRAALRETFLLIFAARLVAAALWVQYWRRQRSRTE